MASSQQNEASKTFGDLANHVARAAGRPAAFVIAVAIVIVWAGTGPIFNYMAAYHQHRHNNRYVPDGFSYSEFPEP